VKLTRNLWAELSELAAAYRCRLECAVEKPLVFAHSPYQSEPPEDDGVSYVFTGENIFYLRETERDDLYRNTVRLKINMPVALEKQEIWRYTDAPVLYTPSMMPYYPFRNHTVREIEYEGYEARYTILDPAGKERYVIYADSIDTKEEAEARLASQGGGFYYGQYDITSNHDRAIVQIKYDGDSDLINASIHGKPIVLDMNRMCSETGAAENQEVRAINFTGSYFSDDDTGGRPQYADWVSRELTERLKTPKEVTIKTHLAVFHARIGAAVKIITKEKTYTGIINDLAFHYKKGAAFYVALRASVQCTEYRVQGTEYSERC
jgi:hypothetical protein